MKTCVIVDSRSAHKAMLLAALAISESFEAVEGDVVQGEPMRAFEITAMPHDLKAAVTLDMPTPDWRGQGKRRMGKKR